MVSMIPFIVLALCVVPTFSLPLQQRDIDSSTLEPTTDWSASSTSPADPLTASALDTEGDMPTTWSSSDTPSTATEAWAASTTTAAMPSNATPTWSSDGGSKLASTFSTWPTWTDAQPTSSWTSAEDIEGTSAAASEWSTAETTSYSEAAATATWYSDMPSAPVTSVSVWYSSSTDSQTSQSSPWSEEINAASPSAYDSSMADETSMPYTESVKTSWTSYATSTTALSSVTPSTTSVADVEDVESTATSASPSSWTSSSTESSMTADVPITASTDAQATYTTDAPTAMTADAPETVTVTATPSTVTEVVTISYAVTTVVTSSTSWAAPATMTDLSAFNVTTFAGGQQNLAIVSDLPSNASASPTPTLFAVAAAASPLPAVELPLQPAPDNASASAMLQLYYPENSIDPAAKPQGGAEFYANPLPPAAVSAARNVSLAYSVFFPADFDWVLAGKLPGLYGGHTGCSGGNSATDCFSTRLMWRKGGVGELYLYAPKDKQTDALCSDPQSVCDAAYGLSVGRGSFNFTPGQWTHVRQTVALNTPGEQDGHFYLTVNDQKVIHRTDVFYRDVMNAATPATTTKAAKAKTTATAESESSAVEESSVVQESASTSKAATKVKATSTEYSDASPTAASSDKSKSSQTARPTSVKPKPSAKGESAKPTSTADGGLLGLGDILGTGGLLDDAIDPILSRRHRRYALGRRDDSAPNSAAWASSSPTSPAALTTSPTTTTLVPIVTAQATTAPFELTPELQWANNAFSPSGQPVGFLGVFFSTFFGGHEQQYATPKGQYTWFKDFQMTLNG